MKAIVSIGCYQFACPVATGSKIVELLGKCDPVEWVEADNYCPATRFQAARVEMRLVQDHHVISANSRKRLPEKAGPDCNGPMLPISK